MVRTKSSICSSGSVRRFDHDVDAVAEDVELVVGDEDGKLDQCVVDEVETGHLAVDPDDVRGTHGPKASGRARQALHASTMTSSTGRRGVAGAAGA